MEQQKILSWNINGLNSPQQSKKIFHYLEKQKCDMICLQETHIRSRDQCLLSCTLHPLKQSKKGIAVYVNHSLTQSYLKPI